MNDPAPFSENALELLNYNLGKGARAFSTQRNRSVESPDWRDAYASFNITHYCGDHPEHVRHCRAALCRELGISPDRLVLPRQVHGDRLLEVDESFPGWSAEKREQALDGIDAVFTRCSGICIGVSTADCVPVLLYEPSARVSAAIHAGWRGVVQDIVGKTCRHLSALPEVQMERTHAVVGPSISQQAFEVGPEVYQAFEQAHFPMEQIARFFNGKWHIDLWAATCLQLMENGIPLSQIQVSGICTYSSADTWFSARRLGIRSGRIFTGILMQDE